MADSPTNVAVSSVPGSPRPTMVVLAYRGEGSSDTVILTYSSQPSSRVLQKGLFKARRREEKKKGNVLVCGPRPGLRH